MQAAHFAALRSQGGFVLDEVSSALQKTVRRGEERQAIFWVSELDLSGYGNYAWKRLRIICSEDVGLAWPEGPAVIRALNENWQETRKADQQKKIGPENSSSALFLVHAVCLLVRAPKSRLVDNACTVFYTGDRDAMGIDIPDYALDQHTARGRRMGRSEATVYDESYQIADGPIADPYAQEARVIDIAAS